MIKVFRISDLIKYFIRILIPIIILLIIMQVVSNQNLSKQVGSSIKQEALLNSISSTITQIEVVNNEENTSKKDRSLIFLSELALASNLKEIENKNEEQDLQSETKEVAEEKVNEARTDVTTEVIDSGVNPRVTNNYNGILINNMSDHELTDEIMIPDIEVNKSKVIIYHTHTCESYTPTEKFNYQASGNYRSVDLNYSVARVGDELDAQLSLFGIQVIHDKTYHDHPAYSGSYSRSLVTAQRCLENNPDTDIVIDLHRDAIADASYAPKVKIGEEYASQLMFVMGGLNENWVQNLKFAIKVMQKANELYPRTFQTINFKKFRI